MRIFNVLLIAMLFLANREAAVAQPKAAPVQPFTQNAEQTHRELGVLLREYPPSLQQVLILDPSLLTNHDYLALYPKLNDFLAQHPEVAHNPTFFVGESFL